MGFCFNLLVICVVFIMVFLVSRSDKDAACRLLESSQHLFEPEPIDAAAHRRAPRPHKLAVRQKPRTRRPYISPLVKKRVAARQKWRCANCKQLLDETFELDHKTPLCRGGHATDEANLQCLCKRCHVWKSAVLDRD